jgi:hypothetical protein
MCAVNVFFVFVRNTFRDIAADKLIINLEMVMYYSKHRKASNCYLASCCIIEEFPNWRWTGDEDGDWLWWRYA